MREGYAQSPYHFFLDAMRLFTDNVKHDYQVLCQRLNRRIKHPYLLETNNLFHSNRCRFSLT